jgi:hypothetical protein
MFIGLFQGKGNNRLYTCSVQPWCRLGGRRFGSDFWFSPASGISIAPNVLIKPAQRQCAEA